jgi:hypothetical protein
MAQKEQEREEILQMRQINLEGEKNDRLKLEKEIEKRQDYAKGLKDGVDAKQGRSGKDKTDQSRIDAITKKIAEEYRKEQSERHERKEKKASAMREALALQILEKKVQ